MNSKTTFVTVNQALMVDEKDINRYSKTTFVTINLLHTILLVPGIHIQKQPLLLLIRVFQKGNKGA